MTPLPPSVAVILGLVIGLSIGVGGTYVLVKQGVKADIAEAELNTVVSGEEAAQEFREIEEKAVEASKQIVNEVENGEKKILSSDGNKFTAEFTDLLQLKISKNRALSD